MWSICSLLMVGSFLLWLVSISTTIYGVLHPELCPYPTESKQCSLNCYQPIVTADTNVTVKIYTSTKPYLRDNNTTVLIWEKNDYSIAVDEYKEKIPIPLPPEVRLIDAQLYLFISFAIVGPTIHDPILIGPIKMTEMKVSNGNYDVRSLLRDDPSASSAASTASSNSILQHWKYSVFPLKIRYIDLKDYVLYDNYLPYVDHQMRTREKHHTRYYEPIFIVDDLTLRDNQYRQLSNNISMPSPQVTINFVPTSLLLFAYKKICHVLFTNAKNYVGDAEIDEIKWLLSDERIYYFLVTQVISVLHVMFEYLAFVDDWKYFTGNRSFKGISIFSLLFGAARCAILFLYLHDAKTSSIVLVGVAKEFFYYLYKCYKVLSSKAATAAAISESTEAIVVDDTYAYEVIAINMMSYLLFPLFVGFSLYCLKSYKYKSWYSYIVSSLADTFYFFGFLHMIPQVYINYRLKSVAHLPMKAFFYKIFNTFIDDVFAFAVDMPLKHRLMTLRDDFIFFIFLYQWYIYPADLSRKNEFGFQYEEAPAAITAAVAVTSTAVGNGNESTIDSSTNTSADALDDKKNR